MSPEERARKLVNGHSLGLPLFEAEDEIAAAITEAVAAERARCIAACERVAADAGSLPEGTLRDESAESVTVATALRCIAWIQGVAPEAALRVVELPGSSESGGRVR